MRLSNEHVRKVRRVRLFCDELRNVSDNTPHCELLSCFFRHRCPRLAACCLAILAQASLAAEWPRIRLGLVFALPDTSHACRHFL